MLSKKAQISDTITWFVATIIIIFILSVSLLFVYKVGGEKKIEDRNEKDLRITKSFTAYLLTDDGGGEVYEQLKDKKTFADAPAEEVKINTIFPRKIFLDLYKNEFSSSQILLRISAEWCIQNTACGNHRNIINIGGLPAGEKLNNKFFHNWIKLKDWGHPTNNTILELMLN
jgi:hypothetical protein